ncbi:hypothetical protein A2U01_0098825, partial [Trifolium medium]|nr:hypothetical protein [Trifolium medium]
RTTMGACFRNNSGGYCWTHAVAATDFINKGG